MKKIKLKEHCFRCGHNIFIMNKSLTKKCSKCHSIPTTHEMFTNKHNVNRFRTIEVLK